MDLVESLLKTALVVFYTESLPFMLYSYGLSYGQTAVISCVAAALKLVFDIFIIRVILRRLSIWWRRWGGRRLKAFFSRKQILLIKNLPSINSSRKIEVIAFFGRLKIIYQKPFDAMGKLRDKLINWAIGVGSLAVFILSLVPMPPIIAASAVLAYIALTIRLPWYKFNNWFFFGLFFGSEIKIFSLVLGLYGQKIF